MPAQLPGLREGLADLRPVFAWGLTGCGGVQAHASEKPRDVHAKGAAPIVVIGTTRDPATPLKLGRRRSPASSTPACWSRRDGDGHTGYNAGNDCVDQAVESYLIDGTVPKDGLSC